MIIFKIACYSKNDLIYKLYERYFENLVSIVGEDEDETMIRYKIYFYTTTNEDYDMFINKISLEEANDSFEDDDLAYIVDYIQVNC